MTNHPMDRIASQVLDSCRKIAGSHQIVAVCICGRNNRKLWKIPIEVLVIIRGFESRIHNYVKAVKEHKVIFLVVDEKIFERDVDRGFLGEALAYRLLLPYFPVLNEHYLHVHEFILKKRLIKELLENIVLDFPELSYEMRIDPRYFLYEIYFPRARIFPPLVFQTNFLPEDIEMKEKVLNVLAELEKENLIRSSAGYVKISSRFIDKVKRKKIRFTNFFKTTQRTLFQSLLNLFPTIMNFFFPYEKQQMFDQRIRKGKKKYQIDPKKYVFIPTANGLISLANKVDIKDFVVEFFSLPADTQVTIKEIGGFLNDVYLIETFAGAEKRKIIAKRFRNWSSIKWFPLTLWTLGTRSFAVLSRSRLERECAINQFLFAKGFLVPRIFNVSHSERLILMEYIDGEPLEKLIKETVNTPSHDDAEFLRIINSVGSKFAEVHAINIALGDTKPENILVGPKGEIYFLDFEQASRNGDKVWDIAEFLFYTGHYISPFTGTQPVERLVKSFVEGYLTAGGNAKILKKVGTLKYTKVFGIFVFPHIILTISDLCRKVDQQFPCSKSG